MHIKNFGWFLLVRSIFSLSVHFHQGAFYLSFLILLHHSCPDRTVFPAKAIVDTAVLLGYRTGRQGALLCKKSILVTFSVPIISLCEVKTSVFIAVFLPN